MLYFTIYDSPLGKILLLSDGIALTGLDFEGHWPNCQRIPGALPVFGEGKIWLDAYFRGEEPEITFPIAPAGTAFQEMVWEILLTIPKGHTRSYGDIAREMAQRLGKEKMSAQAVAGCGPQSHFHYHPLPSGSGGERTAYGLCQRPGEENMAFEP